MHRWKDLAKDHNNRIWPDKQYNARSLNGNNYPAKLEHERSKDLLPKTWSSYRVDRHFNASCFWSPAPFLKKTSITAVICTSLPPKIIMSRKMDAFNGKAIFQPPFLKGYGNFGGNYGFLRPLIVDMYITVYIYIYLFGYILCLDFLVMIRNVLKLVIILAIFFDEYNRFNLLILYIII